MADPVEVLADLRAEGEELDRLVSGLRDGPAAVGAPGGAPGGGDARTVAPAAGGWAAPTPAPGWTVAHQIAHLTWTDERVVQSATDPEGFAEEVRRAAASPGTFVDEGAAGPAVLAPGVLLARWREGRAALLRVLAAVPPGTRLPWYGTSMSAASMATGRLMETWAHGEDIADALGVRRLPTARLRHVARIGVRARDYAYAARGLTPPAEEFRVELLAPDGRTLWTYGPEDAAQRVTGPALDFCLLATRRAHRHDLALRAHGPDADRWLDIAQAFAGPPGAGRKPRRAGRPEEAGDGSDGVAPGGTPGTPS
ncbi:TIGR03084 family metal-binding protein [Streptomyces albireticuli]|uniref:TIGR03084 family metal-binding protein n=1 Tax=Streptomyces albireticuli TaxID=1940 RepID=UPI0036850245